MLECTVSNRSIYDWGNSLDKRGFVSRWAERFCAKTYLSYFCVALFRAIFPFDVGGFVAMEAAVARISYRSEGAGAIESWTLILQFLC